MSRAVITGPVDMDLEPGELAAAVARRVVAALSAQAGLDLDRLSDASILAESLAGDRHAGRVRITLAAGVRVLTITVGPLPDGGAPLLRRRATLPGVGSVVDRLPDAVEVRSENGADFVVMSFGEPGLHASGTGI